MEDDGMREPENQGITERGDELPAGYEERAPRMADLDRVVALIAACEVADEGSAEITRDDLRGSWERPRFALERDARVVETAGGTPAAYGDIWPREDYAHVECDGYVHPDHRGRGIGRWLVRAMERRTGEMLREAGLEDSALLRTAAYAGTRDACELFESEGFVPGRHFWRMVIDLREPAPEPEWPAGVTARTFEPGDEAEVHALIQEAFSDNHRHVHTGLADWQSAMMDRESFDPEQWFLAVAGGRIVGAALCPHYPNQGWVRQLGVARDWRGRGIGTALLRHAFKEFARRGKPHAGLVVDSYNRSGAQRFYLSVSMRIEREHQEYEKTVGKLEVGG
jgi:mycothiol synthase